MQLTINLGGPEGVQNLQHRLSRSLSQQSQATPRFSCSRASSAGGITPRGSFNTTPAASPAATPRSSYTLPGQGYAGLPFLQPTAPSRPSSSLSIDASAGTVDELSLPRFDTNQPDTTRSSGTGSVSGGVSTRSSGTGTRSSGTGIISTRSSGTGTISTRSSVSSVSGSASPSSPASTATTLPASPNHEPRAVPSDSSDHEDSAGKWQSDSRFRKRKKSTRKGSPHGEVKREKPPPSPVSDGDYDDVNKDKTDKMPQFRSLSLEQRDQIRKQAEHHLTSQLSVNRVSALLQAQFHCKVSNRTLYNWKSQAAGRASSSAMGNVGGAGTLGINVQDELGLPRQPTRSYSASILDSRPRRLPPHTMQSQVSHDFLDPHFVATLNLSLANLGVAAQQAHQAVQAHQVQQQVQQAQQAVKAMQQAQQAVHNAQQAQAAQQAHAQAQAAHAQAQAVQVVQQQVQQAQQALLDDFGRRGLGNLTKMGGDEVSARMNPANLELLRGQLDGRTDGTINSTQMELERLERLVYEGAAAHRPGSLPPENMFSTGAPMQGLRAPGPSGLSRSAPNSPSLHSSTLNSK